jgi:gluconokinase
MIVVLMGVTGSGKTTVGKLLAKQLGWIFYDADDFHPPSNIEKMRRGIPLTDDDRRPWLETLARLIDEARARADNIVLACSALKHAYQEYLRHDLDVVHYVFLSGSAETIRKRLEARTGHFMDPTLLPSQLEILDPPADAIRVDVAATPEEIVAVIRARLGLERITATGRIPKHVFTLVALDGTFAIAKLDGDRTVPDWATRGAFHSVSRAPDELSIVCRDQDVPDDVACERGWKCLRVAGQLEFVMTGILASIVNPLAEAEIPVFVISTFNTDYLLVKARDFESARRSLTAAGHRLLTDGQPPG